MLRLCCVGISAATATCQSQCRFETRCPLSVRQPEPSPGLDAPEIRCGAEVSPGGETVHVQSDIWRSVCGGTLEPYAEIVGSRNVERVTLHGAGITRETAV